MMDGNLIEVKGISKSFKIKRKNKGLKEKLKNILKPSYINKQAVKDISFSIKKGEMVGFIGKNGAGKSTTIKMLSGILYPDSGEIKVAGYIPYKQRRQYVANIGVVFGQKTQLSWDLPLMDSFELLKEIYRIPTALYKENLEKFINLLDMKDFLYQPVRQLSLGQRMKGDIVAALLHSPKIVFFDEPTIGLDVVAKENIRQFIKYLNKTKGITMIFTTHDMQDIEKVCNRLIIIDKGEKVYDGSVNEIKNNYVSLRSIEVEFSNRVNIEPINDVSIKDQEGTNGCRKLFSFDSAKVKINELMTDILTKYDVKDISIIEPEIDDIIRDIYEGELTI